MNKSIKTCKNMTGILPRIALFDKEISHKRHKKHKREALPFVLFVPFVANFPG